MLPDVLFQGEDGRSNCLGSSVLNPGDYQNSQGVRDLRAVREVSSCVMRTTEVLRLGCVRQPSHGWDLHVCIRRV